LRAGAFGDRLSYYREVGSTNDVAADLAAAAAPDGTVVVADMQTRGRGRQGRQWFSPPGAGIYFSLIVRPTATASPATSFLTLTAGVAVAEAIEQVCDLRAGIKWPNDLVVEHPAAGGSAAGRRKLAGILAEGTVVGGLVQHVVLGIGINVRESAYPPELRDRVTSLEREVGRVVPGFTLLAECLATLAERWREVLDGGGHGVLDAWRRRSPSSVGAAVRVTTPQGTATGRTNGVDDDGALRVDVEGRIVRVVAGEVEWL
jgi:BirA family biotin operon repressor/biotin-[acetyl-CoA-carboxylase] ligase